MRLTAKLHERQGVVATTLLRIVARAGGCAGLAGRRGVGAAPMSTPALVAVLGAGPVKALLGAELRATAERQVRDDRAVRTVIVNVTVAFAPGRHTVWQDAGGLAFAAAVAVRFAACDHRTDHLTMCRAGLRRGGGRRGDAPQRRAAGCRVSIQQQGQPLSRCLSSQSSVLGRSDVGHAGWVGRRHVEQPRCELLSAQSRTQHRGSSEGCHVEAVGGFAPRPVWWRHIPDDVADGPVERLVGQVTALNQLLGVGHVLQHRKQRHQSLAEWQRKRKERQRLSPSPARPCSGRAQPPSPT